MEDKEEEKIDKVLPQWLITFYTRFTEVIFNQDGDQVGRDFLDVAPEELAGWIDQDFITKERAEELQSIIERLIDLNEEPTDIETAKKFFKIKEEYNSLKSKLNG
jgi:hypothetical protein